MTKSRIYRRSIEVLLILILLVSFVEGYAQSNFENGISEIPKIELVSGKSLVIKTHEKIKRVALGSKETADFILLSPHEIYLKGKAAGLTNIILWHEGGISTIYDVEVSYDIGTLKERLYQLLPDEKEIQVIATNKSLTLTGRVCSAANLSKALTLAKSYVPKGGVNNLLSVGGTHQVMLEVKIAEMDRSVGHNLGINFGTDLSAGDLVVSLFSNFGASLSPAFDGSLTYSRGDDTWSMLINALKSDGLIKILAEPNLIALSGQSASFLAGGEYPIPVPNEDGITVSYKDFGVGLSFTPNVLSPEKINIQVSSSVAELDFSTAVQFSGYVVPGLSSRRATTTVELADGQSFVIAGLLSETIRENVQKFPFLGDIPILGTLFRSSAYEKNETELVIIVTPRFVKSVNEEMLPLPTGSYQEPDDSMFYFDIGRSSSITKQNKGQLDGRFGHTFEE